MPWHVRPIGRSGGVLAGGGGAAAGQSRGLPAGRGHQLWGATCLLKHLPAETDGAEGGALSSEAGSCSCCSRHTHWLVQKLIKHAQALSLDNIKMHNNELIVAAGAAAGWRGTFVLTFACPSLFHSVMTDRWQEQVPCCMRAAPHLSSPATRSKLGRSEGLCAQQRLQAQGRGGEAGQRLHGGHVHASAAGCGGIMDSSACPRGAHHKTASLLYRHSMAVKQQSTTHQSTLQHSPHERQERVQPSKGGGVCPRQLLARRHCRAASAQHQRHNLPRVGRCPGQLKGGDLVHDNAKAVHVWGRGSEAGQTNEDMHIPGNIFTGAGGWPSCPSKQHASAAACATVRPAPQGPGVYSRQCGDVPECDQWSSSLRRLMPPLAAHRRRGWRSPQTSLRGPALGGTQGFVIGTGVGFAYKGEHDLHCSRTAITRASAVASTAADLACPAAPHKPGEQAHPQAVMPWHGGTASPAHQPARVHGCHGGTAGGVLQDPREIEVRHLRERGVVGGWGGGGAGVEGLVGGTKPRSVNVLPPQELSPTGRPGTAPPCSARRRPQPEGREA